MFRVIRTSCSLAVRAMRACAQGSLGGLPPQAGEVWRCSRPTQVSRGVWGAAKPPKLACSAGRAKASPDRPPRGQGLLGAPCAQARVARTARKYEVLMARNMISNHSDMQDKYCCQCYVIHRIQSQYTKVARLVAAPPLLWLPLYLL